MHTALWYTQALKTHTLARFETHAVEMTMVCSNRDFKYLVCPLHHTNGTRQLCMCLLLCLSSSLTLFILFIYLFFQGLYTLLNI